MYIFIFGRQRAFCGQLREIIRDSTKLQLLQNAFTFLSREESNAANADGGRGEHKGFTSVCARYERVLVLAQQKRASTRASGGERLTRESVHEIQTQATEHTRLLHTL
eukprot:gb/GEZJ01007237.1/.p1 GENE.gb/GEZJ01007237.1/~~gb/GEZJ01007237.1/.p1  ORF type:complete len:108 (+),score=6.83 gb/GEZJ01007237.1/:2-325(+)